MHKREEIGLAMETKQLLAKTELKYLPLGSITFAAGLLPSALHDDQLEICDNLNAFLPGDHILFECLTHLVLVKWIRLFIVRNQNLPLATFRVFLLPDDVGRASILRSSRKARIALRNLMAWIDNSPSAWLGQSSVDSLQSHYNPTCGDTDSLFYIFNTLQSPSPDSSLVADLQAADAVDDILENRLSDLGMRTQLYAYQQRSAAAMIQRESQPGLQLDPRLEIMHGPTGDKFYFERLSCHILSEERSYDKPRGGILAESMGHGKTLICLTTILATKNHLPQVPPEYLSELKFPRNSCGATALKDMAILAIYQHNIPWKPFFKNLGQQGQHFDSCVKALEESIAFYTISEHGSGRRQTHIKKKRIYLSSITLVIVPSNLLSQWELEIAAHLENGSLSVLVVRSGKQVLPPAIELLKYDVILMSRPRFEDEISPRPNPNGPPCTCLFDTGACLVHSKSPLLDIHFLRFIVDEGHNFISSGHTNKAASSLKAIRVERKWVVSGTPSNSMLGLELDLTAEETILDQLSLGDQERKQAILTRKKKDIAIDQERKDIAGLGRVVVDFLGLKPWANTKLNDDTASWQRYVMPNEIGLRKPVSLRNVLESLVIRHRNEDIDKDLRLPPLSNRIVRLEPCFFDKLSVNLFLQVLAANAVTSERKDQDYMFHPKNRPALDALFKNLRQSGFFWNAVSRSDVYGAIQNSQNYLNDQTHIPTFDDSKLLEKAISIGQIALSTSAWAKFHESKEIGVYVDNFPPTHKPPYALCQAENQSSFLLGATQLIHVQSVIDQHAYSSNPFEKLAASAGQSKEITGTNARSILNESNESPIKSKKLAGESISARVVPDSILGGSLKLTTHQFSLHGPRSRTSSASSQSPSKLHRPSQLIPDIRPALKTPVERRPELPSKYTELQRSVLVGTASAKYSYLMERIIELQSEEKIIVFYEDDNIAYYIAQALEILNIEHLIYANSLKVAMRTQYLHIFSTKDNIRVMLMDLKQAAHGLHVATASRVFFVNPVWSPSIEAQAIKRAHRIGQTRPVYAETLILKDTPEDLMLQRRKAMTAQEHQKAARSPLDDMTMNDIIKNAKFVEFREDELRDERCQMARLKHPQQIFARSLMGHALAHKAEAEAEADRSEIGASGPATESVPVPSSGKRKIMFADECETKQASRRSDLEASATIQHSKKKRKAMFADEASLPLIQKHVMVEDLS